MSQTYLSMEYQQKIKYEICHSCFTYNQKFTAYKKLPDYLAIRLRFKIAKPFSQDSSSSSSLGTSEFQPNSFKKQSETILFYSPPITLTAIKDTFFANRIIDILSIGTYSAGPMDTIVVSYPRRMSRSRVLTPPPHAHLCGNHVSPES